MAHSLAKIIASEHSELCETTPLISLLEAAIYIEIIDPETQRANPQKLFSFFEKHNITASFYTVTGFETAYEQLQSQSKLGSIPTKPVSPRELSNLNIPVIAITPSPHAVLLYSESKGSPLIVNDGSHFGSADKFLSSKDELFTGAVIKIDNTGNTPKLVKHLVERFNAIRTQGLETKLDMNKPTTVKQRLQAFKTAYEYHTTPEIPAICTLEDETKRDYTGFDYLITPNAYESQLKKSCSSKGSTEHTLDQLLALPLRQSQPLVSAKNLPQLIKKCHDVVRLITRFPDKINIIAEHTVKNLSDIVRYPSVDLETIIACLPKHTFTPIREAVCSNLQAYARNVFEIEHITQLFPTKSEHIAEYAIARISTDLNSIYAITTLKKLFPDQHKQILNQVVKNLPKIANSLHAMRELSRQFPEATQLLAEHAISQIRPDYHSPYLLTELLQIFPDQRAALIKAIETHLDANTFSNDIAEQLKQGIPELCDQQTSDTTCERFSNLSFFHYESERNIDPPHPKTCDRSTPTMS